MIHTVFTTSLKHMYQELNKRFSGLIIMIVWESQL